MAKVKKTYDDDATYEVRLSAPIKIKDRTLDPRIPHRLKGKLVNEHEDRIAEAIRV
jgi:hypothetical protein